MKKLLLPFFLTLLFSSCATVRVDNQIELYNLSKNSIPVNEGFTKLFQAGENVLVLNTNTFVEGRIVVQNFSAGNDSSWSLKNDGVVLSAQSVRLIEDGINSELMNRKINIVDKIIDTNWKLISHDTIITGQTQTQNNVSGSPFAYGDHLPLFYEEGISAEVLEKAKEKYRFTKLLTYRIIGFSPAYMGNATQHHSEIRYILRVIDPNTGLILFSDIIDKKYTPEQSNDTIKKSVVGIGIARKGLVVINVYPNTPASRCGVRVGDKIIEVDGQVLVDQRVGEDFQKPSLSELLNGEPGTNINIKILRRGSDQPISMSMVREKI